MAGLCRDCRFWEQGFYEELSPHVGYGVCDLASNAWFLPPETKVAVRPHQYGYVLTTAADFGCNQFEEKP